MKTVRAVTCGLILLWLAGCATTPGGGDGGYYYKDGGSPLHHAIDLGDVPPAIPHPEPLAATGNPDSYTVFGETYYPRQSARNFTQTGIASWYGLAFHGRRTSSGEPYDMYRMTAAHKTLPIPCYVQVTNLDNGKQVIVRVNDRGPFHPGRIIDLSYVAALKLDIVRYGSAPVRIRTITAADIGSDDNARSRQPRTRTAAQTVSATPRTAQPSKQTAVPRAAGYLQVGAYGNRGNAREMYQQLQAMGIDQARIQPPRNGARRLYRVRIGPFDTVDQRRSVRRFLHTRGVPVVPVDAYPD